jgi:SWIM zinc finger
MCDNPPRMITIDFLVQGSASDPYTVNFVRDDAKLSAYCNCPAGSNGQYCKHRLSIIEGKVVGIVSPNAHDVATVLAWLPGSALETAMNEMRAAERDPARTKESVAAARKKVAMAMR